MNTAEPPRVSYLSDDQLWEKSCAGDREAFRQIVERYQSLICSLAYSRCGHLAWSEDLAQDTFVIAWQRLGELRDPTCLRAWLCGIVRHLADNAARRERRRGGPTTSLEVVPEALCAENDPAAQTISQEEAGLLWRSLERLPEIYREPLVLFYRQNQSVVQVAETLELSADAVKQRLSRGRALLRENLATMVETTLTRTRPTATFTVAVLASVAAIAPPTAKAALIASAAATPAAGMSAGKGVLGALGKAMFVGPAIGLLVSWFGARLAASTARSPAERKSVLRFARRTILFCAVMTLVLCAALLTVVKLYPDWASPWGLIVGVIIWTAALVGWIIYSGASVDREILRIRATTKTDDFSFQETLAAKNLKVIQPWNFESKTRLLGLPLVAIACGSIDSLVVAQRRRAVGWIACGNIAISPLIALGSVAVGPVAVGAVTVGFLSLSLWGIAFGAVAFGSLAAGWWAFGIVALGWRSAIGGVASAHDFAMGPLVRAAEANTPAAEAWFASQWSSVPAAAFLLSAHWIILLIILVAWGRMWFLRQQSRRLNQVTILFIAFCTLSLAAAQAQTTPALLDDFSDAKLNKNGSPRLLIDDKGAGSQSHATQKSENGVLTVEGELVPGRGAPAFISLVSLLAPDGKPQDLSAYTGVRLRVRIGRGNLSAQVGTAEIQNFDYHTSAPIIRKQGEFQEIRIPFKDMKRAWSEQTALNLKTVTSVNLVAAGMAKDAFSYAVDEVGFY